MMAKLFLLNMALPTQRPNLIEPLNQCKLMMALPTQRPNLMRAQVKESLSLISLFCLLAAKLTTAFSRAFCALSLALAERLSAS